MHRSMYNALLLSTLISVNSDVDFLIRIDLIVVTTSDTVSGQALLTSIAVNLNAGLPLCNGMLC